MAMTAGPLDSFNHAISFCVMCDDQAEIDKYWKALLDGGSEEECGWLKDRYGVSWQIVPMAIQHPDMIRNLIVISSAAERDGWYPEVLKGMEAVNASVAEQMKQTQIYKHYAAVAPHPEQFGLLLDRMGELMMRKDYDWRSEIAKLQVPTLLLFADHDAVSMKHIAEFFALFEGGVRDAGWQGTPRYARLAIVPGYTHYNFGNGPDVARVIEAYLTQPTSPAKQVNS